MDDLRGVKQRLLLAYLLLNAERVVATDQLVDAVWGEHPPATATAIVHSYVRRIRSALNASGAKLVTRTPGYVLELGREELDTVVFADLAREGKTALNTHDIKRAIQLLDEALSLWRGEPLGDLPSEGFVADERMRLGQLRTQAVLDRSEAALALGRSEELVSELERTIREEPFQERPRRLLMLALYRSGRQADALALYRDTRTSFVDELGLEPSRELQQLEQAILRQDDSLNGGAPGQAGALTKPDRSSRRARRLAATAVAGLVVAAAITGALIARSSRGRPLIRPATILATIDMPNPSCCGVGQQAIWGVGHHNDVLYRIDPNTNRIVGRWAIAGFQSGIPEPQAGAVWIPSAADHLTRFDPVRAQVASRIPMRASVVAYAYGYMWLTTREHTLVRIDIQRNLPQQVTRYSAGANDWDDGLTFGAGDIWVGDGDTGQLVRIDPMTGHILRRVFLGNTYSELVPVFDAGAIWAFRFVGGQQTLFKIDPTTDAVTARIAVGPPNGSPPNGGIAAGDGYVWTCDWDGKLSKVDERTNRVVARLTLPAVAEFVAYGDGSLWASAYDASEVYRIDPNS